MIQFKRVVRCSMIASFLVIATVDWSAAGEADAIDRLVEAVGDKKLVLLGELPSHGEAETFRVKADDAAKDKLIGCVGAAVAEKAATPEDAAMLDDGLLARSAAIGFTALKGESAMAGMPARPLPDLPDDSLEARATTEDLPMTWLDAERLRSIGVVTSRLFGSPSAADGSIYFDGVLVIRDERGPAVPDNSSAPDTAR